MYRSLVLLLMIGWPVHAGAPATFAFEGWPSEGVPAFTTTAAVEVALYYDYDANSEKAGTCSLSSGQPIEYTSSFLVTVKPLEIGLQAPTTLQAMSWGRTRFLMSSVYYGKGQSKEMNLEAGATIEMLQVRAEGNCLFRVEGEVFEAGCFDVPGLTSTAGVESEWWIQAACGQESGWLRVSDLGDSVRINRSF